MRVQRVWQIKLLVSACMLAALIVVGSRSLAQMRQVEQSDRDERRLERKVDAWQKEHDNVHLNMERRVVIMETYLNGLWWMVAAIVLAVVGQLVAVVSKGAWFLIGQWRAEAIKKGAGP